MTMRERILITGGLGFQGVHLAQAWLAQGRQVTVLNTPSPRARFLDASAFTARDALRVVWGSITDPDTLEKTVPEHEAIVHLAAWASVDQSLDRPWPPFEVNAQGTMAVLEAVRRFADPGVRVLVASSCEVYGPATHQRLALHTSQQQLTAYGALLPQDEDTPMLPRSPYAASKIAADRMAYAYAVTYGLDLAILRPSNVFGPWQRPGGFGAVIPTFVQRAKAGQTLVVTGGGAQQREFLYVEDLVQVYEAALDAAEPFHGEAFNAGSGETCTIRDLASTVAMLVSTGTGAPEVPVTFSEARVADVSGFFLNSQWAHDRLGWKPTVPFIEGLQRYVAWALGRSQL
jgi:UDP-glucose 4-epimerase